MSNCFAWPCSDEMRLRLLLQRGILDLGEKTPGFSLMREGDVVLICLPNGKYVYSATLTGSPYPLKDPLDPKLGFAVDLKDLESIDPPVIAGQSPRQVTWIPPLNPWP